MMKKFVGIITDIPNGFSYKTPLANTRDRAKKLAHEFVNRKNIDYCDVTVVTVDVM